MENSKPHVLVLCLAGQERRDWINPSLVMTLIRMSHDARFQVDIGTMDHKPVSFARNMCFRQARSTPGLDWLMMLDSDNVPRGNPLDVIAAATPAHHIIGLPYGCHVFEGQRRAYRLAAESSQGAYIRPQDFTSPDGFLAVPWVATGVMMIRSEVWTAMQGPCFAFTYANDDVATPICGEDVSFCRLARSAGFKVWTHRQLAGHLKTTDITGIAVGAAMGAAPVNSK